MKPIQLGRLTAKMASGQLTFGNQNPFGGEGENMFAGQPSFDYSSMPGSPAQMLQSATGAEVTKPTGLYGDDGRTGNYINAGFGIATAASPFGLPLNAGIEGIGYLRGNAPSMADIEKVRGKFGINPQQDSYLGAADKAVQGTGWALSHPISGMRMIASDADQAFANDPAYKWMKGKATGAGNFVGDAYGKVRTGMNYAYDQVANAPMGQAFKQPLAPKHLHGMPKPAPAAPAAAPAAPGAPAAPKPLAGAAPKPVKSTIPTSTPGAI
jgi:hypothetical protein